MSEAQATADMQKPLEKQPIFWFYGSASMAYGIKDNAFSYLLLIFANQVLGVPGYLASIALAVAMIWDAVSDLLLGHWSDKTSSKYGRRHPFMYAGLLVLLAIGCGVSGQCWNSVFVTAMSFRVDAGDLAELNGRAFAFLSIGWMASPPLIWALIVVLVAFF